MKIILLFALFGLSFCQDTDCQKINSNADDPNCLAQALTEFGFFFPAAANFLCAYNKFQEDQNTENYNAAANIFIKALNCTGCHVDKILGTGNSIQNILVPTGESAKEALEAVIEVKKLLQIDELVAKIICLAADGFLNSLCLQKALVNIAPDILLNLKKLYCKLNNPDDAAAAAAAAAGVSELLGQLGCALEKQLGFKEGELEKALRTLSREVLQGLVEKLLLLTGKVNAVSDIACLVINPLPPVPGVPGVPGLPGK
ncbi:ranaspumin-like [Rana temporaria]|uniref:ranaspumin-like n=1 Tax=Rana temporaria TaxID=8407 RepID=UPI001AADCCD6|nr:ranaspumin-like [Rana temporaria]